MGLIFPEGKDVGDCVEGQDPRSLTTLLGNGNENRSWYVLCSDSADNGVDVGCSRVLDVDRSCWLLLAKSGSFHTAMAPAINCSRRIPSSFSARFFY